MNVWPTCGEIEISWSSQEHFTETQQMSENCTTNFRIFLKFDGLVVRGAGFSLSRLCPFSGSGGAVYFDPVSAGMRDGEEDWGWRSEEHYLQGWTRQKDVAEHSGGVAHCEIPSVTWRDLIGYWRQQAQNLHFIFTMPFCKSDRLPERIRSLRHALQEIQIRFSVWKMPHYDPFCICRQSERYFVFKCSS